ncbi:MAG: pyruvate dehydrogenase (acetyl-transferring) E1 component subunit alpha [Rhodospirillaceae bacterium]|nr:pyruvate dehydrogenase (acetyl-transferring) E1 component subunit alpha [Rhodospirillaceae bacterium]|tara:strand:- start:3221 stop:4276 length:1056 start_codon:yes stop_codon:yes gene_type:complete
MARNATKAKSSRKASDKAAADVLAVDEDILLEFYRRMLLVRRFEEKVGQMYGMGLIGGFCHLYIGQEAVVVGMDTGIREDDAVITSYRCHGHALIRGVDPKAIMAELTGRAGGISQGKSGSMHIFDLEKGFYGGHGIVGAQVPLGAGIAFAKKYQETDSVSLTFFGEGAANQGQVYETFNMASLWKLPVVFVVENNQYAMGTSIKRAKSGTELCHRGEAFGIPGMQVDGMDVEKVYAATQEAVAHARSGEGPILVEMQTYRYRGHSMSDPAKYRTKDEVQKMRAEHDPIDHLRAKITERGMADDDALKAIDKEIKGQVAAAAEFAQTSPEPDLSELMTDIYVDAPESAAQA